MNGKNVFGISRKAGELGGLWDVDTNYTFYYQPSIFQMDFYQGKGCAYYGIDCIDNIPVRLKFDIIPLGVTKIEIRKKTAEIDTFHSIYTINNQSYTHLIDSLVFYPRDIFNEGYRYIYWRVKTKAVDPMIDRFNIMLSSDYYDKYHELDAISNNDFYRIYFKNGEPVRKWYEDPESDPIHYWPYADSLKWILPPAPPTLTMVTGSLESLKIQWLNNFHHLDFDSFRIYRNGEVLVEVPSDVNFFIDTLDKPQCMARYCVTAVRKGVESVPSNYKSVITDVTPPIVNISYPLEWQVVENTSGYINLQWNTQDCEVTRQVVRVQSDTFVVSPGAGTWRINIPQSIEYQFIGAGVKAEDWVGLVGTAGTTFFVFNPAYVSMGFAYLIEDDGSIVVRVSTWSKTVQDTGKYYHVVSSIPSTGEPVKWCMKDDKPFLEVPGYLYFYLPVKFSRPGMNVYAWVGSREDRAKYTALKRIWYLLACKGGLLNVYVYTDSGYVYDNNIRPGFIENGITRDYYKLQETPCVIKGKYRIRIENTLSESVKIDRVRLIGVDHPDSVKVFVSVDGRIYTGKEIDGFSAFTADGEITSQLEQRDGYYYSGDSGSVFWCHIPESESLMVMCSVEGDGVEVMYKDSSGFRGGGFIRGRRKASSEIWENIKGDTVYYRFTGSGKIDVLRFYRRDKEFIVKELPLTCGVNGWVKRALRKEDGEYYILEPGRSIELEFTRRGIAHGWVRDYIIGVTVRLEEEEKGVEITRNEAENKGIKVIEPDLTVRVSGGIIRITGTSDVRVIDCAGRVVWEGIIEGIKEIKPAGNGVYFVVAGERVRRVWVIR